MRFHIQSIRNQGCCWTMHYHENDVQKMLLTLEASLMCMLPSSAPAVEPCRSRVASNSLSFFSSDSACDIVCRVVGHSFPSGLVLSNSITSFLLF